MEFDGDRFDGDMKGICGGCFGKAGRWLMGKGGLREKEMESLSRPAFSARHEPQSAAI